MRRVVAATAILAVVSIVVGACGGAPGAGPAPTSTGRPSGTVVLYTSLNEDDVKYITEKFEAANPDIKIQVNRKSSEKIVAQLITEVKAGRVLADVLETGGLDLAQVIKEGFVAEYRPAAAASFPASLKDPKGLWTAARLGIETIAWNTSQVSVADAPKSFDDLGDPKWKGKILLEKDDVEVLIGLAKAKYKDDAKAREVFQKIAANQPKPFSGHSETLDLLIAGQGAVFFGAHGHTTERKKKDGAPVDWMRTEAVLTIDGVSLVKNGPNPAAAKVFIDWYLGSGGQNALTDRKRVPALEEARDPALRPQTTYVSGPDFAEEFAKYQKMWQEIFGLR